MHLGLPVHVPNESSTCKRTGEEEQEENGLAWPGLANLAARTRSSSAHKLLNKFIKIIPVADVVAPSGRPLPGHARRQPATHLFPPQPLCNAPSAVELAVDACNGVAAIKWQPTFVGKQRDGVRRRERAAQTIWKGM